MKSITKSCFYLILFLLSPLVIAGQNDYDGKWNVDFTCSINSKNQRPGFSYSEVWDIKGNSIRHIFKTTTKYGAEQTIWDGQITNKNISLKADASRDNGDSWSWIGQGSISSPEAFQINAIMNDKFGTRIRDCVIKFASINPAVGSLAYIQSHPQKPAQKVEALKIAPPAVKPAQTPSMSPTAEIKKPVEVKEEPIKEPAQGADKEPPVVVQIQQPNVEPKPTSTITSETDYWMYLIALALLLLIAVLGFILIRRKKDLGSEHSRKLEEELRKKAEAHELIASELARDQERLKKFEQELKEKEVSLIKKDELVSASSQLAQASIPTSKFCVSCGQNIKFDIKFCPTCGAENKITVKLIDDEKKATRYILKVVAFIFFVAVIAILVFISSRPNPEKNKESSHSNSTPISESSGSSESRIEAINSRYQGTINYSAAQLKPLTEKEAEFYRNIGACQFILNWRLQNGKPTSIQLLEIGKKYATKVQSVAKEANESCTNAQGNVVKSCVVSKLSPSDLAIYDGTWQAINVLKSPQDPNKPLNYEMASIAYCGNLK